jgi:hypothetical protein
VGCCAALATAAQANDITAAVAADPVESITTQIGASGTNTDGSGQNVYATVKPSGGAGCAANYSADTGTTVISAGVTRGSPFNLTVDHVFKAPGAYLLCAWLQPMFQTTNVTASFSTTVAVRIPQLSLSFGVPTAVPTGQLFQVATTTQAEAQRYLYSYVIHDTGRGCPANGGAAANGSAISMHGGGYSVVGGPSTLTENFTLQSPGAYLLCGYLNTDSFSAGLPPEATGSAAFSVFDPPVVQTPPQSPPQSPPPPPSTASSASPPPPPPPCVVPAMVANEPLATTRARLTAASCTPGTVHYAASARYARGSVFNLSPIPGTSLANAARVDMYVSSGAPCIVPALPRSRSLTSVKRRLVAADCTVGKVTHRHSSRHRRGLVLTTSPITGKRLSPRTVVAIVVSSGRARRR